MHAQIITYQLKDIRPEDYKDMVEPDAVFLAQFPGLISKLWLSSPERNEFGGFYVWHSLADMQAFMASDFVANLVARPTMINVHSKDYAINDTASHITRGLT
jgi:hypothetical protein